MAAAQFHGSGDFVGGLRKDDRIGQHRIVRGFIAAMMLAHCLRGEQAVFED